jgi:hypothetical protein
MPSVLAGMACCWLAYLWLKQITDRSTAFLGLLLFSFAPALIELSAEVRQYALLLFFMSACLYLSERAIRGNSAKAMILFSLSLCGALLTHYSALIFAFTIGVYMLVRLRPFGARVRLVAIWGAGQMAALALTTYFLVTHVARLRESGMARGIAETWLRKSIYHAGENHLANFVVAQTLRVFTYTLSHGVGGALTLLAFIVGLVSLWRKKSSSAQTRPSPRELALLFGLPFVVNCGAALAGLYPYGATRHNSFLAVFGLCGACFGIALWKQARAWITPTVVSVCLAICNFFPAPPPLIRANNHRRILMQEAINSLQASVSPGSSIFADYESGLLLGYYLCGHGVVQVFPPYESFVPSDCGAYTAITTRPQEWKFYSSDFPEQIAEFAQASKLAPGTKVWLFDAGWITDSTPALRSQLQERGCPAPKQFGENILFCQFAVSARDTQKNEPVSSISAGPW